MVLSVLTSAAGASARRRTVLRQPRSHGGASSEKGLSSLPWLQCCSFAACSARTRGRPPRPLGSACVRSSRTATCWSPPASTVRSPPRWLAARRIERLPLWLCLRARRCALTGWGEPPTGWLGAAGIARVWDLEKGQVLAVCRGHTRQASAAATAPAVRLTHCAKRRRAFTIYSACIVATLTSWRICLRGYTNAAWDNRAAWDTRCRVG
jgi:hypothetical protein